MVVIAALAAVVAVLAWREIEWRSPRRQSRSQLLPVELEIGISNEFQHSAPMKEEENPWIEIAPGIRRRTIASGATMYQMRAELKAGSKLPEHKHAQEQIAHVIQGRMKLIVSGTPHELTAGDAFYLASNVPHSVETIEDSVVIDTFSPPRNDYLALDEEARRSR
jgi:quercetin dioxygenase-like cupin family protein